MIVFVDKRSKTCPTGGPIKGPAAILADFNQRNLALSVSVIELLPIFL